MKRFMEKKIKLPMWLKVIICTGLAGFAFIYITQRPEGLSSEAMKILKERADKDPYLNKQKREVD